MSTAFGDMRLIPQVKIHFRTRIGNYKGNPEETSRLLNYYLKSWNIFMTKFSKIDKTRPKYLEMPLLRREVPNAIELSDILPLFHKKCPEIYKYLVDVGPMFNNAPHDLKVFIMAICGITCAEYEKYVQENLPKYHK